MYVTTIQELLTSFAQFGLTGILNVGLLYVYQKQLLQKKVAK